MSICHSKNYLLFLLCAFQVTSAIAQKGLGLKITPSYGFGLSYLNIYDFEEIISTGYLEQLYQTEKPKRPLWAKRFGIEIEKKINSRYSIGVGYFRSNRETRSGFFYAIKGTDTSLYSPNYGGAQLRLQYKSFEVPLFVKCQFWRRHKRVSSSFKLSVNPDFYFHFRATQYLKLKDSGKVYESHGEQVNDGYSEIYRIGVSAAWCYSIKLTNLFSVECEVSYAHYFNGARLWKCPGPRHCSIFVGGQMDTLIPSLGLSLNL